MSPHDLGICRHLVDSLPQVIVVDGFWPMYVEDSSPSGHALTKVCTFFVVTTVVLYVSVTVGKVCCSCFMMSALAFASGLLSSYQVQMIMTIFAGTPCQRSFQRVSLSTLSKAFSNSTKMMMMMMCSMICSVASWSLHDPSL